MKLTNTHRSWGWEEDGLGEVAAYQHMQKLGLRTDDAKQGHDTQWHAELGLGASLLEEFGVLSY